MPDVIDLSGRLYVGEGYRVRDEAGLDAVGVHHTVSGGDWSGWALERTIDEEIAHALAICRYHWEKGWGGCGYTDLVFASGRIYRMGPPWQQRAGIGGGHNRHVYSWAFVGNLDLRRPSPAAMLSGGWLITDIRRRLDRTAVMMPAKGHKDFVAGTSWATSCPGKLYRQWMPDLMLAAAQAELEEDDMSFTEQDRADLKAILERSRRTLVKMTTRNEVYEYDPTEGDLVHQVGAEVFVDTTAGGFADVKELPPEHPIWNLEAVYPGGVPPELR